GLRGLALLMLPFLNDPTSLGIFGVVYGLSWYGTAPVSQVLAADIFGRGSVAQVFGWILLSHQVGAAMASSIGGLAYVWFGDYQWAFLSAGLAGLMAAGFSLQLHDERPVPALAAT